MFSAVRSGQDSEQPKQLGRCRHALAYHGIVHDILLLDCDADRQTASYLAHVAIKLRKMIDTRKICDRTTKPGFQNIMMNDVDDYLCGVSDLNGLFTVSQAMREIIDNVLDAAKKHDGLFW